MKEKLIGPILIVISIVLLSAGIIYYGKGYRVDFKKKELKTTGLLAANSSPAGASIFVNGRLTSATNDTINLEPGWYDVRLLKEGYIPWQKKIEIKKEIVAETNTTLFPSNPSLSPLTSTGAKTPSLSPDGTKIAYVVPYSTTEQLNNQTTDKYGVFALSLNNHPFPFSRKSIQLFSRQIPPKEQVSLLWSPDSTQILLLNEENAFLLDADKQNLSPQNFIGTLPSLFEGWQKEKEELGKRKLLTLPEPLVKILTSSTRILSFSPDETKILYEATTSATISPIIKPPLSATNPTPETREIEEGKIYVYDRKEDRNYEIDVKVEANSERSDLLEKAEGHLPEAEGEGRSDLNEKVQWLPTSHHLILAEDDKISVIEYDGTNKATVFASAFEENFVAPFPDASKLVILTSLNPTTSTLPNLYSLSLR